MYEGHKPICQWSGNDDTIHLNLLYFQTRKEEADSRAGICRIKCVLALVIACYRFRSWKLIMYQHQNKISYNDNQLRYLQNNNVFCWYFKNTTRKLTWERWQNSKKYLFLKRLWPSKLSQHTKIRYITKKISKNSKWYKRINCTSWSVVFASKCRYFFISYITCTGAMWLKFGSSQFTTKTVPAFSFKLMILFAIDLS